MYGMGAITQINPAVIPTESEAAKIESYIGKINPATHQIYFLDDIVAATGISPAKVEYQMLYRQMNAYNQTAAGQANPWVGVYAGGSAYLSEVTAVPITKPQSPIQNPVLGPQTPVVVAQPSPGPTAGFSIPFWALAVGAAFLLTRR